MIININKLSKKFKDNLIFENVNLTFKTGKIYGIVGQNGTGKSVFLKILCGFYYPTSGEVLYDNKNYLSNNLFPPEVRSSIEKPSFFPELTAYENLKLLSNIQNKITDNEILNALKIVNLENNKRKKYSEFSLGMKQKLAIASVIMENPKVIILDEAFNGIDETSVIKIQEYLKTLKKNKIIIVASHHKEDLTNLNVDEMYKFENRKVVKIENKK